MKGTAPELAAVPASAAPMPRFTGLVLAFWAGSLWSICGLVAPTLFAVLDDRAVAGRLAARFFDMAMLIGALAGGLLLILTVSGRYYLPGRYSRALVLLTAGLPVLSKLALSPLLEQARAAGDTARFGMLHGISATLFLIACAGAVGLVWNFSQRSR
jgi:hypothetical protein